MTRNEQETRARVSQLLEDLLNGRLDEINIRREENFIAIKRSKRIERETFKLRGRD